MYLKIKESYNKIAKQFSQTRSYNWPEFEVFLNYIKNESNLNLNKKQNILDI